MTDECGLKQWFGGYVCWVIVGRDACDPHDSVGLKLADLEVAKKGDVARARA